MMLTGWKRSIKPLTKFEKKILLCVSENSLLCTYVNCCCFLIKKEIVNPDQFVKAKEIFRTRIEA